MAERTLKRANQIRYRFEDPDLDSRFQWAAGAAETGGLDAGELFWIAAGIDGSSASWAKRFEEYGDGQRRLAADWLRQGRRRGAGEVLMKAYYCYRQAWQFVGQGDRFQELIGRYEAAFARPSTRSACRSPTSRSPTGPRRPIPASCCCPSFRQVRARR